jgi:hypothetical protein
MLDLTTRLNTRFFIGTEVESTAMKGETTLFVVGAQPVDEIIAHAETHHINHIYFIAHYFNPSNPDETETWEQWDKMVTSMLKKNYWVTVDYDVSLAAEVHETGWHEFNQFIAMISVKIPYIKLNNYNTVIKIDDKGWGETNPGVWCHSLHNLMDRNTFTGWNEYTGDIKLG